MTVLMPQEASRIVQDQIKLRQGHELVMLNDANQTLRQHRARTYRKPDAKEVEPMPGDDDMLQLGDNTTINHGSGILPLLATALGGTGLGAAAVMLWALQNNPSDKGEVAQPPAAATPNDDTNTQYEFGLGFPN